MRRHLALLLLFVETSRSLSPQRTTRRTVLKEFLCCCSAAVIVVAISSEDSSASAACLPGDVSKECIGVYKVPMDDSIAGMVSTPEALQRNAPGLNYVPPVSFPQSIADAVGLLQSQRLAADDIRSVVAAGRLEEAGLKVLNLVPKVTAAGRVVVDHVAETSTLTGGAKDVQLLQLQSTLDETLNSFGQVDVSIGQGLRGDLGVVTVAQLTVLGDLKDAMIAFDNFLQQIPKL